MVIVVIGLVIRNYLPVLPATSDFPSSSPAGPKPEFSGIFAVKETDVFDDKTYSNPFISGLSFRVGWKEIELIDNSFNWEKLDTVFEKAAANGKSVRFILIPGFETPEWALRGTENDKFYRKYGQGAGKYEKLPMPWDKTYLDRWFSFLAEVSRRYGEKQEFVAIAVAGPTSVSAEMSLPNAEEDLQKWLLHGYRPSKYISAWEQVFSQYAEIFPNQHFSLALYPGLPINEKGEIDNQERSKTREQVINLGLNYPRQFSLQTSGLNAGKDDDGAGYDIVRSHSGQIVTGFQMSTSATRNPEKMGNPDSPARALKLSIDKGLKPNEKGKVIKYLEIYEPDVLNPDIQSVLEYGLKMMSR